MSMAGVPGAEGCSPAWDAPQHIMLGHTVTVQGPQHFLPPLPPWALLSPTATLVKQDHVHGSGSSRGQSGALQRAG